MANDEAGNQRTGISNRESASEEQQERGQHPAIEPPSENTDERDVTVNQIVDQTSQKSGSRSTAQKQAETRHADEPAPPSGKVDGAFGKEPTEAVED